MSYKLAVLLLQNFHGMSRHYNDLDVGEYLTTGLFGQNLSLE